MTATLPLNDHPKTISTAPLSQEELTKAEQQRADKPRRTPIFPVPDNATDVREYSCRHYGGKPSDVWPYHDAEGRLLNYTARWNRPNGKKKVAPLSYCKFDNGNYDWAQAGHPGPRPLYRLPEIVASLNRPVLVCEGEKAADAAQQLLPDFICTTSQFGAQSTQKTDWKCLAGRRVILCGDLDDAGATYNEAVYQLCTAVGTSAVQLLDLSMLAKFLPSSKQHISTEDIKKGYDLADALEAGWTAALIAQVSGLIGPYVPHSTLISLNEDVEAHYVLKPTGVYRRTLQKGDSGDVEYSEERICSHLAITHLTRNPESEDWGRVVELIDPDGKRKEVVLAMERFGGDGSSIRESLLRLGLELPSGQGTNLRDYLITANPKARARCVSQAGWVGNNYVLPGKIYGTSNGEKIVLQIPGEQPEPFRIKGTLTEWQQQIGQYLAGNPRVLIAVLAALAAPIHGYLQLDNFFLHFAGSSSVGKTTTLCIANSAGATTLQSWRTTDNAIEGLCRRSNHRLLPMDELSQVDAKAADAIGYLVGNGQGKARANKYGEPRPIARFNLIGLSSGEIGLAKKLQEGGRQQKAGQAVRFIEIQADAGKGLGIFNCIHDAPDSRELSDRLKQLSRALQGAPLDAFLKHITTDIQRVANIILEGKHQWVEEHCRGINNGQAKRVAGHFGLLAAVGEVAVEYGILPIPAGEADVACQTLFQEWHQGRGGDVAHEYVSTIKALAAFMAEYGNSRFEAYHDVDEQEIGQRVIHRAGVVKKIGSNLRHYLFRDIFRNEICGVGDPESVAKQLADAGIFIKGSGGRTSTTVTVKDLGKIRAYRLDIAALNTAVEELGGA